MIPKPARVDKARHLACEGGADKAFFERLLAARGLGESFQVHDARGKDKVGTTVSALLGASRDTEIRSIVVVVDSDNDPQQRITEIRGQIKAHCSERLVPPAEPLTFSTSRPATAIVPIPWPNRVGCLETLLYEVAFLSARGTGVRACIESFGACVGAPNWDAAKQAKLRWQALVAAANASKPEAATTWLLQGKPELFDWQHPSLDPLAQFFASIE